MSATDSTRVDILDPLRGLAALAVAWFHFTHGGHLLADGWLKSTGTYGWLGVEAFFVISGFVLPLSLYRGRYRLRSHALTFVLKRIVRLDPPFIATIALTVALAYASTLAPGFAGAPPSFTWTNILLHLGYLNAFVGQPWINPVFWTLAVEFQFYILIALAFPVLMAIPRPYRGVATVALGALTFAWPDRGHVIFYLPLFAFGVATFDHFTGRVGRTQYALTLAGLTLVGLLAMDWPMAAMGLATALVVAFVRVRVPRWLASMGLLSYSLYLVHVPIGGRVVNLGTRWADTLPAQLAVLAVAVALSLAAAYAMYWLVEKPSQRLSSAIRYRQPDASRERATERPPAGPAQLSERFVTSTAETPR